MWKNVFNGFIL
eukprot:gene17021-22527_t